MTVLDLATPCRPLSIFWGCNKREFDNPGVESLNYFQVHFYLVSNAKHKGATVGAALMSVQPRLDQLGVWHRSEEQRDLAQGTWAVVWY